MALRKIISLFALLTFLIMLATSVVLYLVPQGRFAYWSDWRLFGITKTQWGNIHINTGVFFLLAIVIHIYYNWNVLLAYLKNRAKKWEIFTPNFNIAFFLSIAVVLGTYFEVPPFSSIIHINESLKETAAKQLGEPPYGHAELSSLKLFTSRMRLDIEKSFLLLKKAGMSVSDENQKLVEIARVNGVSPQKVYEVIKSATLPDENRAMSKLPETPEPGLGMRTLAEIIQTYGLDEQKVMAGLRQAGYNATPDMTMKTIANAYNISPMDVFEVIRQISSL